MSNLLTDADLTELLGVSQAGAQARILSKEYGLKPFIRRDGRPRVTWDAVTAAIVGQKPAAVAWEPDLTAAGATLRRAR